MFQLYIPVLAGLYFSSSLNNVHYLRDSSKSQVVEVMTELWQIYKIHLKAHSCRWFNSNNEDMIMPWVCHYYVRLTRKYIVSQIVNRACQLCSVHHADQW